MTPPGCPQTFPTDSLTRLNPAECGFSGHMRPYSPRALFLQQVTQNQSILSGVRRFVTANRLEVSSQRFRQSKVVVRPSFAGVRCFAQECDGFWLCRWAV